MKIQKLLLAAFSLVLNSNAAEKPSTPRSPETPTQSFTARQSKKHRDKLRAMIRLMGAEQAYKEITQKNNKPL